MRDRAVAVLGDGFKMPFVDGVSEVVLNRQGLIIYGDPAKVRGLQARLGAQNLRVAEIVPTDGKPFVEVGAAVSQSFPIPWYAGQQAWATNGSMLCSTGFAFRIQWNGTWWYESTAGHCAYDIPTNGITDWGTSQVSGLGLGYWYEPQWPGMGWTQIMWDGSLVCCPPLRQPYDISLFSVNSASQPSRPSPVSHIVVDYCPGGCHRQTNTTTLNITSAITNSGTLSENSTYLVKSGQRTGTSTGIYRGVRTDGRGYISDLNNCGVWDGDSGGAVFRHMGSSNVQAVGIISSRLGPADDANAPSAPSYCGLPNNKRNTSMTFAWVHVLQAATGATVVTTST